MSRITLIVLMHRLVRLHVGRGRDAGLRKLLVLDVYQTTVEFNDAHVSAIKKNNNACLSWNRPLTRSFMNSNVRKHTF